MSDFPDGTIGDKVTYTRDGVVSKGRITSVLLDPSRTQIRFTVKCDDQNVIQTTREFLKFDHDVDVSKIPQTTEDYMKECSRIDPEHL